MADAERGRVSAFKELGMVCDARDGAKRCPTRSEDSRGGSDAASKTDTPRSMARAVNSSALPAAMPAMPHVALLVFLLALVIPGLPHSTKAGRFVYNGVQAGALGTRSAHGQAGQLVGRADSPTDVCVRFSHQSAIVNGTLYVYGGQAKKDANQISDTWNNNLVSLPLDKNFEIGTPTLKGLAQPSGPPPVANGFLWNSYTSLFLYGGLFSDKPAASPLPFSMWEYDIAASSWKEHEDPKTSAGNNSAPEGVPIQRAAEGAGLNVPQLGRGWYFGGHLDGYTTEGWSQSIPRVYLKSFVEYTFPGFTNDGVKALAGGKRAPAEGTWRNITEGGLQDAAGFTERADGVLAYVPGWGRDGIILGLAGGTNATFTQMNVIDIYDIADSTWYKQATNGPSPGIRVNPCAVVAAAPDGSSINVYMYGGQNLIPYGSQKQYDDMWILTIPSFTWIQVKMDGQSNPPARAGHTCNVWDGQMVVVGGYVGQDISCDSPGVYVFDMSKLEWQPRFTALSRGEGEKQQSPQEQGKQTDDAKGGSSAIVLDGGYGYTVPVAVQSVVGGNGNGGATVTGPVQSATKGPIATGRPPTFTVTADGGTVTETGKPGSSSGAKQSDGLNVGAVVAGVIAGVLAVLAGYLGFCAWVYRRQLQLYKNHVAMTQRQAAGESTTPEKGGLLGARSSHGSSDPAKWSTSSGPSGGSSAAYAPVAGHAEGSGRPTSLAISSTDDLMAGQEPSFLGVLLSPRRSLRVINRD